MPPQKQERWSGLKGKPQSANMRFLLEQGKHRFPGPGYNTWHNRIEKEERGHLKLIREKINDYFAYHDEADNDPTLQGPMTPEGVGRGTATTTSNSVLGGSILAKLSAKYDAFIQQQLFFLPS